jgi:hypothetical protein
MWLAASPVRADSPEEARLLAAADKARYDNRALEALEPRALLEAGSSASRDGALLRLHLKAGGVKAYRNTPECAADSIHEAACTQYGLVAHLRDRGLFVVDVRPYEGGSFLLVDERTGRATELPDFPELSADGRLAFVAQNSEAYGDGGLEVWRRRDGRFIREWRGDPPTAPVGRTDYHVERWTRGGELIIRVETVAPGDDKVRTSQLRLRQVRGGWRLVADPKLRR